MSFHGRRRTGRAGSRTLLGLLVGVVAIVGAVSGCGADGEGGAAAPDYTAALQAAPPELAAVYAEGDVVLDGGRATYERLLKRAKGHPVVVNNWASWCMPCREEFPYFQAQAAARLDEVLFLGVDSEDSTDAAETFLRDHPLPYPSVAAPSKRDFQEWIGRELVGYPNTVFYDRRGAIAYTKQGPYRDEAELAADIETYALGG